MFSEKRCTIASLFGLLCFTSTLLPLPAVENIRLSHDISALGNDVDELYEFSTEIREVQLTPDGTRALYLADEDYDGVQELFSVRTDGTEDPVKLHTPLAPPHESEVDVVAFKITSDGSTVVYGVGQENLRKYDLWTTSVDGTGNPSLFLPVDSFPTPQVGNFLLTSDGLHVVFNVFNDNDNVWELFSARLDKSAPPVKLSLGPVEIGFPATPVEQLVISPDNQRVVYVTKRNGALNVGVYSAEIGIAGSELFLNENPTFNGSSAGPRDLSITPDSSRVLYRSKNFSTYLDLISVPIDVPGSAQPIDNIGGTDVVSYVVSETGNHLAFHAFNGSGYDLYRVAPSGGAVTKIRDGNVSQYGIAPNGSTIVYIDGQRLFSRVPGGAEMELAESLNDIVSFAIHPDSQHVTFLADLDTQSVAEFYTVPVGGGAPEKIHTSRTDSGRDFQIDSYQISPDSQFVVFNGTGANDDVMRLYSAPARPGPGFGVEFDISGPIVEGGAAIPNRQHTLVSTNTGLVVFTADRLNDEVIELFSTPLSGGTPTLLNQGYAPVGDVDQVWASPNSEWLVYRADFDWDDRFDLYLVPSKRELEPVRLNEIDARTSKDDTGEQVEFTPDSSVVVFLGVSTNSPFMKLFMHDIVSGITTQLSPEQEDVASNSNVSAFQLHPDGESVVYIADHDDPANPELYRVRFDTPKVATKLIASLPSFTEIDEEFVITSDGAFLLFTGDYEVSSQFELFRYNFSNGSVANLSDMPNNGQDVSEGDFRLVLYDEQVVFRANRDDSNKEELFIVEISTASTPEKISGSLVAGGDVRSDFSVTPDGEIVVFQADANRNEQYELFSVDLTAVTPTRVKLNSDYPFGADGVEEFRISPDGTMVAFRSQEDSSTNPELFLATIGQSQQETQVSPNGADDVDVTTDFAFSPNNDWIFFRTDILDDEQFCVFKYRVSDGLSIQAIPGGSGIESFQFANNGHRFIYRAAEPAGERAQLYSAFTDRLDLVTRLDEGGGSYTDVLSPITILPDSSQVVFMDDRFKDGTYELHTAFELPMISPIANQFVLIDHSLGPLNFSVGDLETPPTELVVSAVSADQTLIPDGNIVIGGTESDRQITITPAPGRFGGPTTITVTLTAGRETVTEQFDVLIGLAPAEYRGWLAGYFNESDLDDPTKEISLWGLLADPDNDELPNIAEWAKGLNPNSADADQDHLSTQKIDDDFVFQVRRAKPFPTTLGFALRQSFDLSPGSWTPIPFWPDSLTSSVIQDLGAAEIIEYRYQLLAPEPETLFLRILYSGP